MSYGAPGSLPDRVSRATWTCTKCDPPAVFTRFAPAQRHANEAHHGARIAIDVPAKRP